MIDVVPMLIQISLIINLETFLTNALSGPIVNFFFNKN